MSHKISGIATGMSIPASQIEIDYDPGFFKKCS